MTAGRTGEAAISSRELARAADALAGRRVAVITGAGISTASGIPDYRGSDSPPRNPMTFQQFTQSEGYRRHYWARTYIGYQFMEERQPNAAHLAIADWERKSPSSAGGIITQNIDTLHQKAGSGLIRPVIDLHGRFDRVSCMTCHRQYSREFVQGMFAQANPGFAETVGDVEIAPDADAVLQTTDSFSLVYCPHCGGDLRPDVVFFGEVVPRPRVRRTMERVDQAQALLVLGSSLAVHSGWRYVARAVSADKPVVIVNIGPTRGDKQATVRLEGDLSVLVPELLDRLSGA